MSQSMDDEQAARSDAAAAIMEADVARGQRRARDGKLFGLVWLVFLVYPVAALLQARPLSARPLVALGAIVVFAAADVWIILRSRSGWQSCPQRPGRAEWLALSVLAAVPVGLILAYSGDSASWLYLFIYTSTASASVLPERLAGRVIIGLTIIMLALGVVTHADWSALLYVTLLVPAIGYSVIGSIRMTRTIRELRMAREEIARLAVSEERLRFARDLHDLLGHSLSLIVLKSELAGRLAEAAPERAGAEMHDVEGVARAALREVREAVTGYRQPTLAEELRGAREMLAAAGIAYWCDSAPVALPAATEAVLAWAVREGVTNVIRHSGATGCAIHVASDATGAGVEVVDDGRGAPHEDMGTGTGTGTGSGLRGLVERVAAQGGDFAAGPDPTGGFRLRVRLPLGDARPEGPPVMDRAGVEVGAHE